MIKLFLCVLVLVCFQLSHAKTERLQLTNLVRHPCKKERGFKEPIVLPKSEDTVLLPDENDSGCYTISGPVSVKRRIGGSIQIYVETKYGDVDSIAPCRGATVDNCGGVGSCVFCDTCIGRKDPNANSPSVQLRLIGRKLDCRKGVNAGNYTDLGISFCLPTLDDFLRAQGMSRERWNRVYKKRGQTIRQTFYIFNEPINLLNARQLQNAVATRRNLIACDATVADVSE